MLRENPLGVATAAVAVGAAVGFLLPETRQEDRMMGEARDSFMERARSSAGEAQEKVQRVVEKAQSAAESEARDQGLTG
jgi:hypothetical protein